MIVARSSADSCSKCLVITIPISVEVLHLILDSAALPPLKGLVPYDPSLI